MERRHPCARPQSLFHRRGPCAFVTAIMTSLAVAACYFAVIAALTPSNRALNWRQQLPACLMSRPRLFCCICALQVVWTTANVGATPMKKVVGPSAAWHDSFTVIFTRAHAPLQTFFPTCFIALSKLDPRNLCSNTCRYGQFNRVPCIPLLFLNEGNVTITLTASGEGNETFRDLALLSVELETDGLRDKMSVTWVGCDRLQCNCASCNAISLPHPLLQCA